RRRLRLELALCSRLPARGPAWSEQTALLAHHLLAHQRDRRAAKRQEFVVEIMPPRVIVPWRRRSRGGRGGGAVLCDPIVAQLANHQFAERVVQIRRIVGPARRLL